MKADVSSGSKIFKAKNVVLSLNRYHCSHNFPRHSEGHRFATLPSILMKYGTILSSIRFGVAASKTTIQSTSETSDTIHICWGIAKALPSYFVKRFITLQSNEPSGCSFCYEG